MKFLVNYPATYLPLKMSKGTAQQRLDRARELNEAFFQKLRLGFQYSEISPGIFVDMLKKTTSHPIHVEIIRAGDVMSKNTYHLYDDNGVNNGYLIALPLSLNGRIVKSDIMSCMAHTQLLFNEILNPKFFKRVLSYFSKSSDARKDQNFYINNISTYKKLTKQDLTEFLKDKTTEQQIDVLQMFRYKLASDDNLLQFMSKFKKKLPKEFKGCNSYYGCLKKSVLDEKRNLISGTLADIIQKARAKN